MIIDTLKENSNIAMAAIHVFVAVYIYKGGVMLGKNLPAFIPLILIGGSYYIYHILHEDVSVIQNKLYEAQKQKAMDTKAKKPNIADELLMTER